MQQIILNGISFTEMMEQFRQVVKDEITAIPSPDPKKKFLTIEEATEMTGYSKSTIYRMTSERTIPHLKNGGKLMFSYDDLSEWLMSGKKDPLFLT
ncbi:MAG TPA: helix-turn-helix domain-containing protein [Fulvivirga sp.]|nr:helix-turn-helix domain-containing protein [Fulvivirga sp.]